MVKEGFLNIPLRSQTCQLENSCLGIHQGHGDTLHASSVSFSGKILFARTYREEEEERGGGRGPSPRLFLCS